MAVDSRCKLVEVAVNNDAIPNLHVQIATYLSKDYQVAYLYAALNS